MPSRSVPFGVKPRTWSATSSPRKPSMGSPASNPYAPTPRACWIPAANTGVLKTVSTTFATSPLMKIARASAVAQAPRSWPPFAISPYRFSASPELATSPQHFAAVLVRAIPSSFASSGCDFDVAVFGQAQALGAAAIFAVASHDLLLSSRISSNVFTICTRCFSTSKPFTRSASSTISRRSPKSICTSR